MVDERDLCALCNLEPAGAWAVKPGTAPILRMCQECSEKFRAQGGLTLRDYLDTLSVPVLMVDSNVIVKIANRAARELMGKQASEVEAYLCGQVFECVYSRLPGGCGQTVHCSACTIRKCVTHTFTTGETLTDVPAYINQRLAGKSFHIDLHISTQRVWNVVLLRVDRITPRRADERHRTRN
jgi:hypothetical protein